MAVEDRMLFAHIKIAKREIREAENQILKNNKWERLKDVSPALGLWTVKTADGVQLVMDKAAAMKAVRELAND